MPVTKAVSGAKAAQAAQPKGTNGHGMSAANVDDLSAEEIEQRYQETLTHLAAIVNLWPGLRRMSEEARKTSSGKGLPQLGVPLRMLFTVLSPVGGKESPLAKHFDALGDKDQGKDPTRFEPELLLRRMDRVEAERDIHDRLEELTRHFGDDILWTGAAVVGPGKPALDLAKTLAQANAEFETLLLPVVTALRAMTRQARNALKNAASEDTSAPAEKDGAAEGNGAATTAAGSAKK